VSIIAWVSTPEGQQAWIPLSVATVDAKAETWCGDRLPPRQVTGKGRTVRPFPAAWS
jgi:hypothetical protein